MKKIDKIDELLSDPDYIYHEGFWVLYGLVEDLSQDEWMSIASLSANRGKDWNENLFYAAPFRKGIIENILSCVFATLNSNPNFAVKILSQLDSKALEKNLNDARVRELAEVWRVKPELRTSIKTTCIDAQKAGILRQYLNLSDWKEADVIYPTIT